MIRSLPFRVSLFFLSSLIVATVARAATVQGTVADPHGAAVPAARVLVIAAGAVVAQTDTDAQGRFVVDGLPAGALPLGAPERWLTGDPAAD